MKNNCKLKWRQESVATELLYDWGEEQSYFTGPCGDNSITLQWKIYIEG